jgi:riboflavin synthase
LFTGIVVERGSVRRSRVRGGVLDLEIDAAGGVARELDVGDSVAVNGACLTATATSRRRFSTEVVPETAAHTTLGDLKRGDRVNLELPLRTTDRLGGHLVQGHVDGVARAARVEEEDGVRRVWFTAGDDVLRYLVHKGSVALDGVSLTVVEVGRETFQVALIPHTLRATTLGAISSGTRVNVEVDIIAKYVERLADGEEQPYGS